MFNIFNCVERVTNYLGIEPIPVTFMGDIIQDSRIDLKPDPRIVINAKHKDNDLEIEKCIAHECRHVFQIFWARLMDDGMAEIWKKELKHAINKSSQDYNLQMIEIDAFAFTQVWIKNNLSIDIRHPNDIYQIVLDKYIEKNRKIL